MTTEYAIQEYHGYMFKNAQSMERALAKDENWSQARLATRYVEDAIYPRTRLATREEALTMLKDTQETYERTGRIFRLVSREISDWEVVDPSATLSP